MCLAEALLRVPDTETIDALIEDKIGASDWAAHLGHSSSPLVNASTWAVLLTGKMLAEAEGGLAGILHEAIRRLGEPVIRAAVAHAMRELGHRFVFGRTMREAKARAAPIEARGCSFSYDMLGEAARTEADARRYHLAYSDSIGALAGVARGADIRDRPGVSVKLSALHARYEFGQRDRVMTELTARLHSLALLARSAGIGLKVDAEEADPVDLPGPTGESNRLSYAPRGVVLCLGPGVDMAAAQIAAARTAGNAAVAVAEGAEEALAARLGESGTTILNGQVAPEALAALEGVAAIACSADHDVLGAMRRALARRPGPILPLITELAAVERYVVERHLCVDTTASGGNASLLAEVET